MSAPWQPAGAARGAGVDIGLAACAVVLFALGQSFVLVDWTGLDAWRPLDAVVRAGNVAVTVLLTLAGFRLSRAFLRARRAGWRTLFAVLFWYAAEVAALLLLVVGVVFAVHALDASDPYSWEQTRASGEQVLRFGLNDWVAAQPLAARPDLASLWYFSVEAQLVAATFLATVVLGRWPTLLAAVALTAAAGSVLFRVHLLAQDGWFVTSVSTLARADAFLLGVAAAALSPRLRLPPQRASGLCGAAALVLAGLVMASSFVGVEGFFTVVAPVSAGLAALFAVGATHDGDLRSLVTSTLSAPELAAVGRAWRPVLAWSLPVLLTLSRHLGDSPGILELGCAAVTLASVTAATMSGRSAVLRLLAARVGVGSGRHRSPERRSAT